MQATDGGYLTNRSILTFSEDGSTGRYRAPVVIDPHQVVATSVEWGIKGTSDLSGPEKEQLLGTLRQELTSQLGALSAVPNGRPVLLRAAITRVEVVSPGLNTLATVLLIGPLDRGGAAVEVELLDAQTRSTLASYSTAYYAPLSEFKARFSRLAPAELAVKNAANAFAQLAQNSASVRQ